jgi:PAS domain S-box-containing protein
MTHFASKDLLGALDGLLPASIADQSDVLTLNRARTLTLVVLGAVVFAILSAAYHWGTGNATRCLFNLACTPLALLVLWSLHRPGRAPATAPRDPARAVRRALFLFLSLLLLALSGGPFLSQDGFGVPVALAVVPFLAASIGGLAVGWAWTAVTLSVLCVMAIGVSPDPARGLVAWNTVIVAGVVGIGGCLAEMARAQARRDADSSSREASGLARSRDEKEAELRASRDLLSHAFRRMPAMLILSELATGRIVDVNECFERLSGWTLAEVRGRTLSELKAWGSVEDRQRLLTTMLDRGQTLDVEILMRTKSGGEIWLLAAADILEMNGSQLVLAQGVDITDRKRAEQALARSRQLLEDRVVERSERLRASQLELRRQRQLASIGTLAAGVAHQINPPIASIMASAEYALLAAPEAVDGGGDIRDQALRSVIAEAMRCGQIVKNVLRFARQQPTARWVEDLVPLVRRTAAICQGYVVDQGGQLRIDAGDGSLSALVSPIEIEQVLVNLIRNAAESLDGGGVVRVGVYSRDQWVEIAIDDEGRGIPLERLEHLFEPFYTTRVHQGGTGLGLSFAHGVVVDHGGAIHVESEVGKGTRIRILIPRVPA